MSRGSVAFVIKTPESERWERAADRLTPGPAVKTASCRRMRSGSRNRIHQTLRWISNPVSVLDLDLRCGLDQRQQFGIQPGREFFPPFGCDLDGHTLRHDGCA
jgi:hypothetical protein